MKMLKHLLAALLLAAASMSAAMPALGTPLAPGGTWTLLNQHLSTGNFFTAPDATTVWTLDCPASGCIFVITDLSVFSAKLEVYDGGVLIATTPPLPDWFSVGAYRGGSNGTFDPFVAFASGNFGTAEIKLGAGSHSLEIRDIHRPADSIGAADSIAGPDGTVAFRAIVVSEVVPEPATLALFGIALVGLGFVRRKRS